MQCKNQLLVYKHPSVTYVKLAHISCINEKDGTFNEEKAAVSKHKWHLPYDEKHRQISGKTHASIRYYTKAHMDLEPQVILEKLKQDYPLLMKVFLPELRKIHDIAFRERKILAKENGESINMNELPHEAFRRF